LSYGVAAGIEFTFERSAPLPHQFHAVHILVTDIADFSDLFFILQNIEILYFTAFVHKIKLLPFIGISFVTFTGETALSILF
jgi:hypothetical protein